MDNSVNKLWITRRAVDNSEGCGYPVDNSTGGFWLFGGRKA